ncbi:MAG: magnesium/cobalt transporter CorA [Lewinellaceae bacterium]|nr:magnesium/cobalt transporter CorA [Lewinellaceae bacterium]
MGKRKHKKIRKKGLSPGTLIYTGHRSEVTSSVRSVWYDDMQYHEKEGYALEWSHRPTGVFWADVRGLTDTAAIERIGTDLQLHHLALEDVLNTQQRSKLEEYDQILFFILHNLHVDIENRELVSEQIAVFIGERFVISFQENPDDTFQPVRKRAEEGLGRLRKKDADYLGYTLLDMVVDNYYLVLDDIETALNDLESELHSNGTHPDQKARIFDLKRTINQFRRHLVPLRDAAMRLYRSESPLINDANRLYLRDLTDHVTQILDSIDNYRELLAGVEALYQAEVSNRLNNVMRLLTIISTIFIPLSFIAGVYGMNFDNMPELHWKNGYFLVLGAMAVAILAMLAYFRRNKWL